MKKIEIYLFSILMLVLSSCDLSGIIDPSENGNEGTEETGENTSGESEIIWSSDLALNINPALGRNYMPAIDEDDNIYVMMMDFEVNGYVLQKFDKNGKLKWTKTDRENIAFRQYVTYYNGKLYYPTNNNIICINASNGEVAWTFTPADTLETTYSLTVASNKLVISLTGLVAEHSYLGLINSENGSVLDMYPLGWRGEIHALASNGSTIYASYNSINSFEISGNRFTQNWTTLLPKNTDIYDDTYTNIFNDIVIDPENGNIYFTYENIHQYGECWLVAYNRTGGKLWESDIYGDHLTVSTGNQLYVGTSDLYKLDGNTGNKQWGTEAPAETLGFGNFDEVTLAENDILYAGDIFGLYGVNTQGEIKFAKMPDVLIGNSCPLTYATMLSNGNLILMAMAENDETKSKIYCLDLDSNGIKKNIWAKWGADAGNTFNLAVGK